MKVEFSYMVFFYLESYLLPFVETTSITVGYVDIMMGLK